MTQQRNTISCSEALNNLFAKYEHFTPQEYHNEMMRLFPMYRNRSANIPSEAQIERWILEDHSYACDIEGRTGVSQAEEQLGIKIGEDYHYPRGFNSFEYNLALFYEHGFLEYTDYHVSVPESLKEAYICAWQNLHFHNFNEKDRLENVRAQFEELCELNPQVRKMVFDKQNEELLRYACDGIIYGYPVEDVQLFVSEHARGNTEVSFRCRQKIENESQKAGLPEWFNFQWVPSSETIWKIGENYQKAKKRKQVHHEIKESRDSYGELDLADETQIVYNEASYDDLKSFMENGESAKTTSGDIENTVKDEPAAEVIYQSLCSLEKMTAFYGGDDVFAHSLMQIYLENGEQMTKLKFWKNVAMQLSQNSSSKKDIYHDVLKFGTSIAAEVKKYSQNAEYMEIKQKCASAPDFVKAAYGLTKEKAVRTAEQSTHNFVAACYIQRRSNGKA